MGIRGRSGQKKVKQMRMAKAVVARRAIKLTRHQAEMALSHGEDPTQERFTKHANAHVRAKAWRLMGSPMPETQAEQDAFLKSIHKFKAPPVEEAPKEEDGVTLIGVG
jgi:hypothetical protein